MWELQAFTMSIFGRISKIRSAAEYICRAEEILRESLGILFSAQVRRGCMPQFSQCNFGGELEKRTSVAAAALRARQLAISSTGRECQRTAKNFVVSVFRNF